MLVYEMSILSVHTKIVETDFLVTFPVLVSVTAVKRMSGNPALRCRNMFSDS